MTTPEARTEMPRFERPRVERDAPLRRRPLSPEDASIRDADRARTAAGDEFVDATANPEAETRSSDRDHDADGAPGSSAGEAPPRTERETHEDAFDERQQLIGRGFQIVAELLYAAIQAWSQTTRRSPTNDADRPNARPSNREPHTD